MKRCPTCQRTYAEDSLMYCLDDGSTLLRLDSGPYDPPPTMRIPDPRVTNQPPFQQFPPPYYGQASGQVRSGTGFKFTNKVAGISGASLVVVGVFLPFVSLMGFLNFSYLQVAMANGDFFTCYIVALVGIGALLLTLKQQYRPLIGAGIVAIAILLIDFFRVKSNIAAIASGMFPGMPGARAGTTPSGPDAAIIQNLFGISWGFFAMVAGGVLLIVAGAMKDTTSTSGTNWDSNVPPSILK